MAVDYYQSGFLTGRHGAVGRPPYDPRDPLTMVFVNEYNRGYDDGCKAKLGASIRLSESAGLRLPRGGRSF
jgi:hypothetical protein